MHSSIYLQSVAYANPGNVWNMKLSDMYPSGVPIHTDSSMFMGRVLDGKGTLPQRNYLGTDTTQSTLPIYEVDSSTPLSTVRIWSTWRYGNDSSMNGTYQVGQDVQVPIPSGVRVPGFADYQVVIYNVDTGDEWNFWLCGTNQAQTGAPGRDANDYWQPYDISGGVMRYTCESAGLYRSLGSDDVPGVGGWIDGQGLPSKTPKAWGSRGAKVPYGLGLVRKWEIDAGVIDHAIAWAYHGPSPEYVYPALNSDGANFGGIVYDSVAHDGDLPEGARIRLDPTFDLGLLPAGTSRIVGKALQDYGAICIDNAGFPKIYLEATYSAGWGGDVTPSMLSVADLTKYQVIDWGA